MNPQKYLSNLAVCVSLCLSFCVLERPARGEQFTKGQTIVVSAEEAQVFRGKEAVGTVAKGQELVIIDQNLAWLGIEWTTEAGERKTGWIRNNQVTAKLWKRTIEVAVDEAQVFRGKEAIGTVRRGQRLIVIDENVDWFGVQWITEGEARSGWIRKELTSVKPKRKVVIVNVDEAQVFRGSEAVGRVQRGQALTALRERGEWLGVEWTNAAGEARSGWIKREQIVPKPEGEVARVKVEEAQVLRGSEVVGSVKKGQELIAIQRKGDWVGIEWRAEDGALKSGWVKENQITYLDPAVAAQVRAKTRGRLLAEGILIRSLRLEGNTLISTSALLKFFPEYLVSATIPTVGVRVSLKDLRGALESILNAYHEIGYRGVAVYIPQDHISRAAPLAFRNDELKVQIVEGRVLDSTVSYRVQRKWRPWRMKKEARPKRDLRSEGRLQKENPIVSGDFLQRDDLEGFVEFLERHPGRSVAAVVKKAEAEAEAGEVGKDVALEFRVVDPEPTSFYVNVSNTGSESAGEERFRLGFIHNSLLGRDDILALDFQGPFDSGLGDNYGFYGSYEMPLWSGRWRAKFFGAYSEFKTSDILGPNTPFLGEGLVLGEELSYRFLRRNGWSLDLFQGLDFQSSKVDSPFHGLLGLSTTITDVELLDLSLGARAERAKGRWRPSIEAELSYNLSDMLGLSGPNDFNLSRTGSKPGYLIARGSAQYRYLANDWLSLYQKFGVAYSPDRLASAREFAIGGLYNVRGYEESEVLGDRGLFVSTEPQINLNPLLERKLKRPIPVQVGFIPLFLDVGAVDINGGPQASTTLVSIGSGANLSFKDLFSGRLYWGHTLRDADPDGTKDGDNRLHFDMTLRF